MYEVKTQQFAGPLQKLLELIETKKLNVNSLSLAEVTADFLNYVRGLEINASHHKEISRVLADFIVIAAKLLLIKSKSLLPELPLSDEEESEIKDLELRLKIYRELRLVSGHISFLWNNPDRGFGRELFLNRPAVFFPSANLNLNAFASILNKLSGALQNVMEESKIPGEKIVSVQEKISDLLARMRSTLRLSFHAIIKNQKKGEIIAFFLAVLHLIRDHLVDAEQSDNFSDIIISSS